MFLALYNISSWSTDGVDMECDFEQATKERKITTKYHFIDFERHISVGFGNPRNPLTKNKLLYQDINVIRKLREESEECRHSIDQLCQPSKQLLYEIDVPPENRIDHICLCLGYLQIFSQPTYE